MWIKKIDEKNKELAIAIPLANATGKTRIKMQSWQMSRGLPQVCPRPTLGAPSRRGILRGRKPP